DHDASSRCVNLCRPQTGRARPSRQGSAPLVELRPARRPDDCLAADRSGGGVLWLSRGGEGESAAPGGLKAILLTWAGYFVLFVPGALAGGVLGWFVIRPVNWILGTSFG